jgi:hypothetical protein
MHADAQDAVEYFQHLLEVMTRAERAAGGRLSSPGEPPTAAAFGFQVEDRVQCSESGRVSYKRTPANVLSLDIDPDAATNKDELDEYKVGGSACSAHAGCLPLFLCASGQCVSFDCHGKFPCRIVLHGSIFWCAHFCYCSIVPCGH